MNVFFSDLDGTLIYSHKRNVPNPKRPVESLDGNIISYMTENTYQYLTMQTQYCFVPVTTRTEQQFKRISVFREEIPCQYALVCNGAILLENGNVNAEWMQESERLALDALPELRNMAEYLHHHCDGNHVHSVGNFMVYFVGDDAGTICQELEMIADRDKMIVCYHRNKLYCIAKNLTKGSAVRRFMQKYPCVHSIASGDSTLDIPMLSAVNTALCPEEIAPFVGGHIVPMQGEIFSDQICEYLKGGISDGN